MKWIRFSIDTHVDAIDFLSYMLDEMGIGGIEIEDHLPLPEEDKQKMFVDILPDPVEHDNTAKVHFYMEPENCDPERIILQVQESLRDIRQYCETGAGTVSLSETEDKDWINNWKTFFKPFRASKRILVKPTWEHCEKERAEDILIEIDPGIAFGTGSHETTKLCIQALDEYIKPGDSILDVGCGSGILSIAALGLGARHATAIDIDPTAIQVAGENMDVNHVATRQYALYAGNLLTDQDMRAKAGTGHEIVIANILADVILMLTGMIRPHMKKGGLYITSGIIDSKEADIHKTLQENGFEIVDIRRMNEWCCFIAR